MLSDGTADGEDEEPEGDRDRDAPALWNLSKELDHFLSASVFTSSPITLVISVRRA